MKSTHIILFFIVNIITILHGKAQSFSSLATTATSSYSIFGLGEPLYTGTAENMGKGGLGAAVINPFSPTFNNSASFFHNRLTSFQIGVKLTEKQQLTSTQKNYSNVGYLSYATIAVPIYKWWGSGIGIMPLYGQGYDIQNNNIATPLGNATYQFTGKGNLNSLVWSNGINPFKWFNDSLAENFSVGFGLSYMFGNSLTRDRIIYENNVARGIYNQLINSGNVYDGFQYNFGMLHKFKLLKNYDLTLGATYDFANKINAENTSYTLNYAEDTSTIRASNIYGYQQSTKKITLPSKYSLGATITFKNKLNVGLEYKKIMWSKYKYDNRTNNLIDATSYILGAEYVVTKPNNYTKNTYYRLGLRYTENPYKIGVTGINEKAVSIGYSQPIETNKTFHIFSNVNVSFEYMQRGTKLNNLVLEHYFSAYVGLTINDKWFIKQKYD